MSDFKAKMHQIVCRLGLHPRPRWWSLQRSPDPPAGFYGPTSKGEGKGREGREREGAGSAPQAKAWPPQNYFPGAGADFAVGHLHHITSVCRARYNFSSTLKPIVESANTNTQDCVIMLLSLASCLIYARAILEYVIFIMWVYSVTKMLLSVKFAEDKVPTSLFSVKNAKIVQLCV